MTISKDLFLAILSMDSYNRGYGAGLSNGGPNDKVGLGGIGSSIGNATVTKQSDIEDGSAGVAAGFYAVSYKLDAAVDTMASGTVVISYRGTDNFNPFTQGNDVLNGWVTGLGFAATQAGLAESFYEAVTTKDVNDGESTNTSLTGHSLGGGLAGYANDNHVRPQLHCCAGLAA